MSVRAQKTQEEGEWRKGGGRGRVGERETDRHTHTHTHTHTDQISMLTWPLAPDFSVIGTIRTL